MKLSTLFATALLLGSTTVALAQESEVATSVKKGDLKFENAIQKGYSQISTPMAITSEGNVVVTAVQVKGQSLGSYIAMATPELASDPIWKLDITGGRSEVTAIVADGEGGVFVAGNFNDKITLGGALGGITLTGKNSGQYIKTNAFVAHIDKSGQVVAANMFRPTINPELTKLSDKYLDGDNVNCNIFSLAFANGKLYAGMLFTDIISSEAGDLTAGSYNLSSWGMGFGSDSDFTAVELDQSTLKAKSFPVVFGGPGVCTDASYMGFAIESVKMTSEGNKLYFAVSVGGFSSNAVLKVNGEEKDKASFKYAGGLNGMYMASVDMSDGTVVGKAVDGEYSWSAGTSSLVQPGVASIAIDGEYVYVGGSFKQNFPFAKELAAVGNTDMFFVRMDKAELSDDVNIITNYAEKTSGDDCEETFSAYDIADGNITLYGAVTHYPSAYTDIATTDAPLQMTTSFPEPNGLENDNPEGYTTGVVTTADGKTTYYALLDAAQSTISYKYIDKSASGINDIETNTTSSEIFNLQGMKLSAPQKGVNIIGGKKVVVK